MQSPDRTTSSLCSSPTISTGWDGRSRMAFSESRECNARQPVWWCGSASNQIDVSAVGDPIPSMISIEEALTRILSYVDVLPAEEQPLVDGLGQVLAADVSSSYDIPPLDNTAMDGY